MIVKNKTYTENDLRGENFISFDFLNCKFKNINFRFVNYEQCIFKNCDFSGSFFDIVSFSNCSFPESSLGAIDFSNCDIKNCNFLNTILSYSIFQKLKNGNKNERIKSDLRKSSFESTRLVGSVFVLCNLSGVSFSKANLESVVFEGCDLTGTDFTEANINGVNFNTSKIEKTYLDIGGFLQFGSSKGFRLK